MANIGDRTEREPEFQRQLTNVIETVISKYRYDGVNFSKVQMAYAIAAREADIVLFRKGEALFLIIETKRKGRDGQTGLKLDPRSRFVVGQVISYIALYEQVNHFQIPYFAAANGREIVVFKTPENVRDYVYWNNINDRDYEHVLKPGKLRDLLENNVVFSKEKPLDERTINEMLDTISKTPKKLGLVWNLIFYFRHFIDRLTEYSEELIRFSLETDDGFKKKYEEFEKQTGSKYKYKELTRMMADVLIEKIVFYKMLEKNYPIKPLKELPIESATKFLNTLNGYFENATSITEDFIAIFKTGIFDEIKIPDNPIALIDINDFISTVDSIEITEIGPSLRYVFENVIPPEERHKLGQFYTTPAICELICKWVIRRGDDLILDPGCGSGGFVSSAYERLLIYKTGSIKLPAQAEVHHRILKQLYAVDIHPYATHVATKYLSIMNIRAPYNEMNIINDDFFCFVD